MNAGLTSMDNHLDISIAEEGLPEGDAVSTDSDTDDGGYELGEDDALEDMEVEEARTANLNDQNNNIGDGKDGDDDMDDDDVLFMMAAGFQFLQGAFAYLNNRPRRNPIIPFAQLNIDAYDDATCEALFRFRADEIRDIAVALRLPDVLVLENGSKVLSLEALCLVLRRLAYPCRFVELMQMFGRSVGMLSRITTCILRWIHQRWAPTLLHWDHVRLRPAKLEEFAAAIHAAGSPLRGVVGFIDGDVRPIARPAEGQERDYNGHHRVHAMKYQAVTSPDGLVIHLSGPYQERHHDMAMYRASDLQQTLYRWAKDSNDGQIYLYGGPGYVISPVLQVPYPNSGITPAQRQFNERMSAVRVSVEWTFEHVLQYVAFADFKKSQRSLLSQVHLHYTVSVIFSNIHSCITETNPSVDRFGVRPPTLEEYLHN